MSASIRPWETSSALTRSIGLLALAILVLALACGGSGKPVVSGGELDNGQEIGGDLDADSSTGEIEASEPEDGADATGDSTVEQDEGDVPDDGAGPLDIEVVHPCLTDADCDSAGLGPCEAVHCNSRSGQCEKGPAADGTSCGAEDKCSGSRCKGGACEKFTVSCNDENPCTDDSCDPGAGCVHGPNTGACDDGNACTTTDSCSSGQCVGGPPPDCDDKEPCTDDSCDPLAGCVNAFNAAPCDDGNACSAGDACKKGVCVGGGPPECDDKNPCTIDLCDPGKGCVHVPGTEQCDDGNACTTGDSCSEGTCKGSGALACDDGEQCTTDSCNPVIGCVYDWSAGPCDDGNACTAGDLCEEGKCVPGSAPDCDDKNPCTVDSCVQAAGCVHQASADGSKCDDGNDCTVGDACAGGECKGEGQQCDDGNACTDDKCTVGKGCFWVPNANPCDDGNACTVGDKCVDGQCTGLTKVDCDDANPCTTDWCDVTKGCMHEYNSLPCDDGNACTTKDQCSGGGCVGGQPQVCDDGNPCTSDSCDPVKGCAHEANSLPCDDGNACTAGDACSGGKCTGGATVSCEDSNPCTIDLCIPAVGCAHQYNSGPCDDGNACTTGDTCKDGACGGAVQVKCDDGNPCTTDTCAPAAGCVFTNNTLPCNDGNGCTSNDTCQGGVCKGVGLQCDDGNACTDDTCAPETGCAHVYNTKPCEDGSACTVGDKCAGGKCVPGAAPDCDDKNPCTTDACNATTGCVNNPNTSACDDGNPCTTGDKCGGGKCAGGSATDCDDKNQCTTDSCDPGLGCLHTYNELACDDANKCTTGDKCSGGKCVGGPPPDCDDGNPCTTDGCDNGCTHVANTAACDDKNACTTGDKCGGGKCSGTAIICDDKNPCTTDSCDPVTGCVFANNSLACDDGDPCTTGDKCSGGICITGAPTDCDDKNPCTTDSCTKGVGCAHSNLADGTSCGAGLVCKGGVCGNPACDVKACPNLAGYNVTCNAQQHCEYTNTDATGWKQFDVWIYIPPGSFTMGSLASEVAHQAKEEPVHAVTFAKGFLIGKYEVTVLQYEACQSGSPGTCTAPSTVDWDGVGWGTNMSANGRSTHPQNGLTWAQAGAVCTWLGGRRPSEAEWEYAATGSVHRKYPWGDTPEPKCANNTAIFDDDWIYGRPWGCNSCTTSGCSGTSPVGSKVAGASWSGALDMAGNIWEWTEDWYHSSYVGAPTDGSAWLDPTGSTRAGRGGGYYGSGDILRSAARGDYGPSGHGAHVGVRCARDLPVTCGGVTCPTVAGYKASCNAQQACEYSGGSGSLVVYVPAGAFWMGANKDGTQCPTNALDTEANPNELPCHQVTVPGFLVDKYEVTVSSYKSCNTASPGTCSAPSASSSYCNWGKAGKDQHPVNCVTWTQMDAYCKWAGRRLCSEAEWEKAARGTDGRKYPWGNQNPTCDLAVMDAGGIGCGTNSTMPVGSKTAGASPYGAMDLAGNVWEWVQDWYHDTYAGAPTNGSAWESPAGTERILHGAAFINSKFLRASCRGINTPGNEHGYGSRCCKSM